jgi:probable phosphoglycerate mutase
LDAILARHADGDAIALVSHQVVVKTLVCALARLANTAFWHVRQDLCNLSHFDYDPITEQFILVGLNDTCHLDPALPHVAGGGTRVILIRHGQTAWNAGAGEERFRGRADLPLDAVGQAQAQAVAGRAQGEAIAMLYASPLQRTRQTAAPLADSLVLPLKTHDALIDIQYGHFQGLTHSEAAATHPAQCTLWRTKPSQVSFPGGEGLIDVQARLLAMLAEMVTYHPDESLVLVGHQIVNKVMACTLMGLDLDQIWRIEQATCGIDVFQQVGADWHTLCLNDTCHLH